MSDPWDQAREARAALAERSARELAENRRRFPGPAPRISRVKRDFPAHNAATKAKFSAAPGSPLLLRIEGAEPRRAVSRGVRAVGRRGAEVLLVDDGSVVVAVARADGEGWTGPYADPDLLLVDDRDVACQAWALDPPLDEQPGGRGAPLRLGEALGSATVRHVFAWELDS